MIRVIYNKIDHTTRYSQHSGTIFLFLLCAYLLLNGYVLATPGFCVLLTAIYIILNGQYILQKRVSHSVGGDLM